jgi:hypothetical protein
MLCSVTTMRKAPSMRKRMKTAFMNAGISTEQIDRASIFNDYGKQWKKVNFYGGGSNLTKAECKRLHAAIEAEFGTEIVDEYIYISYHLIIKVRKG